MDDTGWGYAITPVAVPPCFLINRGIYRRLPLFSMVDANMLGGGMVDGQEENLCKSVGVCGSRFEV